MFYLVGIFKTSSPGDSVCSNPENCSKEVRGSQVIQKFCKKGHVVSVIATLSGKQTHLEGQCRQWSAVYYTSGPRAEFPLSQGPRPAFVKTFYTPCVRARTHHPKFLETYKGRLNTITTTPSFTCYVIKPLIINKPAVTFQPVNN